MFFAITGTQAKTEKMSDSSSPKNDHWPLVLNEEIEVIGVKQAATKQIMKGYSSGESSSPVESRHNHHRDNSDLLGLEEMKTALLTDGTLNTNVVRMEV